MSLWNGKRGALSLTFDDALPCQLEHAIPEMDAQDIKGTFFAIGDCPEYPLDVVGWRGPHSNGHEIGSHSVKHRKAADLGMADCVWEATESKRILENHFGTEVVSFCYPYTDAPPGLRWAVEQAGYKQARGGRVARSDKYIAKGDGIDLWNVPCFHVNEQCFGHQEVQAWVYASLERHSWLTLMFHGVGDGNAWDNVARATFRNFMEFLRREMDSGLWVAPFGTVAENFREWGK